jgi:predicted dehydrogenase
MRAIEPIGWGCSGITGRSSKGEISFPQIDQFAAEMDDFAACILNNRPSRVPGEEGLRDLRVVEAVYQSSATGRAITLT